MNIFEKTSAATETRTITMTSSIIVNPRDRRAAARVNRS